MAGPITIADLENAKVDVETIAGIANSTSPTIVDRLGRTRRTLDGVEDELDFKVAEIEAARVAGLSNINADVAEVDARKTQAINIDIPNAVATVAAINNRGAWAPATAYALKDIVLETGVWYMCVVAHTSSAAFATDVASKWRVYQGVTTGDLGANTTNGGTALITQYDLAGGRNLQDALKQTTNQNTSIYPTGSIVCLCGDSITDPSLQFTNAMPGLVNSGGIWEGRTLFNMAANGKLAQDWANSIASGNQSATPINSADTTTNLWRFVNAKPTEIFVQLGTNDRRTNLRTELQLETDLIKIAKFLLEKTTAFITFQCPPPFVYIAGSVSGFANFANADDAATRSAGIRAMYLRLRSLSSRIQVIDTHRHLFPNGTAETAYRWDSLAAAVHPQTGAVLMLDELHYSQIGQTLRAQIITRYQDPSAPYLVQAKVAPQTAYQTAALSAMCFVKAVGVGYVDIYADSIRNLLGSLTSGYPRGPLKNIPRNENALLAGAASLLRNLLRAKRFRLWDFTSTELVVTPTAVTYNQVDGGIQDYWRVSVSGTPAFPLGAALAYVVDLDRLPNAPPDNLPISIYVGGASGQGATVLPMIDVKPIFFSSGVQGRRQNASGGAVIGLYASNTATGTYSGTVSAAYPGLKLGTLTFANTGYLAPSFVADPTNFPGGTASLPDLPNYQSAIYAVLESGSLGEWGNVVIRPR